nr:hypothetical protein Iba_chr12cCG5460 [Ipomoea batatas]
MSSRNPPFLGIFSAKSSPFLLEANSRVLFRVRLMVNPRICRLGRKIYTEQICNGSRGKRSRPELADPPAGLLFRTRSPSGFPVRLGAADSGGGGGGGFGRPFDSDLADAGDLRRRRFLSGFNGDGVLLPHEHWARTRPPSASAPRIAPQKPH